MSWRRRWVALGLGAVCCLVSAPSLANGRFPRALRVVEHPTDRDTIALAATYGVLITSDRGASWHYVCEAAFTDIDNYVGDPLVDFTPAGDLLIGTESGLVLSRDGGCDWRTVLGSRSSSDLLLVDFTVRRGENSILALVSSSEGALGTTRLEESSDDGESFSPVGSEIPVALAYTLDSAPSDPDVVYVSGLDDEGGGVLAVSTDGGESWSLRDIPGTEIRDAPYIAAIHPRAPQRLFVRTDGRLAQQVIDRANDALFYTEDGGQSWRELMRRSAKLLGFALSPDGQVLLIGYGDPVNDTEYIDTRATGAFMTRLSEGDAATFGFRSLIEGSVTCLGWTANSIFVCRPELENSYHLTEAGAPDFTQPSELEPLLELDEVKGPLACAESVCGFAWRENCLLFDSCGQRDAGNVPPEGIDATVVNSKRPVGSGNGSCACRASSSEPTALGLMLGACMIALVRRSRLNESTAARPRMRTIEC